MYFCKDDRRLFAYEQLMQQPPFYTPRRSGLQITDKEDLITKIWGEKGAKMISEFKRSDFLSRMYQVCGTKEWRTAFRSHEHLRLFEDIATGERNEMMCRNSRYCAAVFLLSACPELWERSKEYVRTLWIRFDRIIYCCATPDQFLLCYMAKEMYEGRKIIEIEDLKRKGLLSEEMHRLFANAFLIKACGVDVLKYFGEGEEFDE